MSQISHDAPAPSPLVRSCKKDDCKCEAAECICFPANYFDDKQGGDYDYIIPAKPQGFYIDDIAKYRDAGRNARKTATVATDKK